LERGGRASERAVWHESWGRKLLRPGWFAVGVVILLLAAGAGYLGYRAVTLSNQLAQQATERSEVQSDAAGYAVDLTTYDYHDLDAAFQKVAADSTPGYAAQYRSASQQRAGQLVTDKATSSGRVVATGIQDYTPGQTADVLVLVNQTVTNTNTPAPQVQRSELRITLTRSDVRWLISALVLL
jgi:Mce-associated membrane protein